MSCPAAPYHEAVVRAEVEKICAELGLNHERLTLRHNGLDRRLTDVHGRVIREVLA